MQKPREYVRGALQYAKRVLVGLTSYSLIDISINFVLLYSHYPYYNKYKPSSTF
jgi:hypothetical protein